jgi:hypothetical protein
MPRSVEAIRRDQTSPPPRAHATRAADMIVREEPGKDPILPAPAAT